MLLRPSPQSNETWRELIDLRCQREVIDRWLASCSLPDGLQQYPYAMLGEIDDRLDMVSRKLGMD